MVAVSKKTAGKEVVLRLFDGSSHAADIYDITTFENSFLYLLEHDTSCMLVEEASEF